MILVCVMCVPAASNTSGWLSTKNTAQTTLAADVVYDTFPITVDVWQSYPDLFFGTTGAVPEYYSLWWNPISQSLNTPPLDQQVSNITTMLVTPTPNASLWVCMRPEMWSADYHSYYNGTEPEYSGFSTNGIVLSTSNHTIVDNITATINPHDWNYTGWYRIYVAGDTAYQIDNETYFVGSVKDISRLFYLNTGVADTSTPMITTTTSVPPIVDNGRYITRPITDIDTLRTPDAFRNILAAFTIILILSVVAVFSMKKLARAEMIPI